MLDLNAPVRSVAGVDLMASDDEPTVYYVLPPGPRVARTDNAPDVELLRFVRNGSVTGGHLHLTVELSQASGALDSAREALTEETHGTQPVELRPVPVLEASAELTFLGRVTDSDGGLSPLLRRELGRSGAGLDPPYRASFSVMLTPEGAAMLEAALRSGGAPIAVVYRLRIEGLWPAARVVAHVDWGRVYDHFSSHTKQGNLLGVDDVRQIAESLVEDRAITIQAIQGLVPEEGGSPPDLGPALDWIQQELVERFCEPLLPLSRSPAHSSLGTAGEIFGVGSAFAVKALTQIERATADVDFQRRIVVARTLTAQAHVADLLDGSPAEEHIGDAAEDHPFFRRFGLHVRAAAPLAESHLQEALLKFGYGTFQSDLRLTPDAGEARTETWADASPDGTWTIQPSVTFAADAPLDAGSVVDGPALTGQSRELTIDLDRLLGLVRLDVEGTTDARVVMTAVRLVHSRNGGDLAEQELGLTPAAPGQSAWFRDHQPGDRIVVAARYLLADGRAVSPEPFDAETRVVRLPPPFPGSFTVFLAADDDWTGLERVVVTLQKDAAQPTGTFAFDHAGQSAAVSLDLPDPTDRRFRYRMTRTWETGEVEEDDWVETDVPLVAVGRVAANKLVVDVTPVGPELPAAGILLIEVELSYLDPAHQLRDQRTAVIRAKSDRFHWEVALADPNRREYEYRITTYRTSGDKTVGQWTTGSGRILPVPVTPS